MTLGFLTFSGYAIIGAVLIVVVAVFLLKKRG
jgi:hypothetical protein